MTSTNTAADTAAAVGAVIAALETLTGMRPSMPLGAETPRWWPWDARGGAVDLSPGRVEVRVIAAALPLPPLLEETIAALRAALTGTAWSGARLRVVVTELDAAAFATTPASGEGVT
ncbi:hypothetical protein [Nocardia sp. NPDC005366]|uniref:hypothetical protein n=1 Tax=Nocardia sp. NPDC005366 TaxID=3156878 RepID=UPI0033AFBC72